jgi:cell division protein ZapD
VITYEYPFNERIRTLLRLENLFEKVTYFIEQPGWREHHVVLLALFEMLEVAGRADLKTDLIQELERQRQSLLAFRNNPEISEEKLSGALYEIEQSSAALLGMTGKIGHYLRENDWLMAIRSRAAIPGGVCQFDLPSYYYWLNQEASVCQEDLREWVRPLIPLRDGMAIVLRLLRASGSFEPQVARGGFFQLSLSGGASQMVRISLEKELPFVPEISANRYALNIRFVRQGGGPRFRQCDGAADVPFDLEFCNL